MIFLYNSQIFQTLSLASIRVYVFVEDFKYLIHLTLQALMLMNNLAVNLVSPEFENHASSWSRTIFFSELLVKMLLCDKCRKSGVPNILF